MLNTTTILDGIKESVEGEKFESMDDFETRLLSIVDSIVDDVYATERFISQSSPDEIKESLGVEIRA